MALAELADRASRDLQDAQGERHGRRGAQLVSSGPRLILAKPNSFMNLSGGPVAALLRFYKLDAVAADRAARRARHPVRHRAAQVRRRPRRPQRHARHRRRDRHRATSPGCASASAARPAARTPPTSCCATSPRRSARCCRPASDAADAVELIATRRPRSRRSCAFHAPPPTELRARPASVRSSTGLAAPRVEDSTAESARSRRSPLSRRTRRDRRRARVDLSGDTRRLNSGLSRARTLENALGYAPGRRRFLARRRAARAASRRPARCDARQRPAGAARDRRDRPRVRVAARGARAAYAARRAEIIEFPAWETLPHERLSPSAETVGKRIDALRRLRDWQSGEPRRSIRSSSSPRVRAALQPLADNLTELEPVELDGGRPRLRPRELSRRSSSTSPTRASTWSPGAASSRCAAASSTCSRRSPSTRCASSSSATRSSSSAPFSVADQRSLPERDRSGRAAAEPRAAAQRRRAAARARDAARVPEPRADAREDRRGHPGRGHGVARPRARRPARAAHRLPARGCRDRRARRPSASRRGPSASPRRTASSSTPRGTPRPRAPRRRSTSDAGDFLTLPQLREAARRRGAVVDAQRVRHGRSGRRGRGMSTNASSATTTTSASTPTAVPSFAGQVDGAIDHVGELLPTAGRVVVVAAGHGPGRARRDVLAERGSPPAWSTTLPDATRARRRLPGEGIRRARLRAAGAEARRAQRVRVLRPHRRLRLPPGRRSSRAAARTSSTRCS